ncbi:MAG: rod shape-determining protein MreC [Patescibacteria group bacterium]|nr:rod shape-determining protein MreC [Patescibacteria group bacterium]
MIEKRQNRYIKFYVAAVIILLVFLHYLGALAIVEDYFLGVAGNFQNQTYTFLTKLKYSFVNFQEAQDLKKESIAQKDEIAQLTYENSQLKDLQRENEQLRQVLGFVKDKDFDYVVAKVIGRDLARTNTLIINRGRVDGLRLGLPVVVNNGVIIGKIFDLKENTATILLLTDQLSQLSAGKESLNKPMGLANGEFGLSIKLELIPQDTDLQAGDVIITSGQENDIPRGLVIGQVNRIISYENELFKSATINPLADYGEITILSVIIPKIYNQ